MFGYDPSKERATKRTLLLRVLIVVILGMLGVLVAATM
jgi:hypothetical protein